MSPQLVSILARIYAVQAGIIAMQTTNLYRTSNGMSEAYDEDHFWKAQNELECLSPEAQGLDK